MPGSRDSAARDKTGLRLVLISIHGLIRGRDLELGRDADTGGQTLYVVELARALARRPEVAAVDIFTRRIVDPLVSDGYARRHEPISDKARIIRLDAGPDGYLPKEALWEHLDSFADNALAFVRAEGHTPDIVHSHYADAGYVGRRLAAQLDVPLVHTGHSLGRVKRRRLLAAGLTREVIEARYQMTRRVRAEEDTLASAELVIASTADEVEEQYALYDHYQPDRMHIVPPGVDFDRFHPPGADESASPIARSLARFLIDPERPQILAISRPDERKNLAALVEAFAESAVLREQANLVVVAGCREDVRDLGTGAQAVLTELLLDIDRYDLHGLVAYPKRHRREEVPVLYRLAAASGGVFVNPALTEPFGLTLLEAAATGLPVVATENGGPREIIANCGHGLLVDPLDSAALAAALVTILGNRDEWQRLSRQGLAGVRRHYSWEAHAERYLAILEPILGRGVPEPARESTSGPVPYQDRALFSDLDQNLLGDPEALARLARLVRANRKRAVFGIATGRSLESALQVMRRHEIPVPDVLISSLGTAIHYAPEFEPDAAWARHIDHLWTPQAVRDVLDDLPGLMRQPRHELTRFKISYYFDPAHAPPLDAIKSLLHQADQSVNVSVAFGQFLDVTPVRASKGMALRWVADRWEIPLGRVLAAGGSGADEDMMRGNTLAVVVANRHKRELREIHETDRIHFASASYAAGILEAVAHYDFYGACAVPREQEG